jgi:hypothetical protein
LLVEVFDPVAPSRTLLFSNGRQSLAAIVDGAGSWGTGHEAADLSRSILGALWAHKAEWSTSQIVQDITVAAARTPESLRDPEFGWSFSVTTLLFSDGVVESVAAGFYRVDVLGPRPTKTLFRPSMLVDDLLAKGILTPDTLETFPHRHICLGRFVGDNGKVSLAIGVHTLSPTDTILVTHAARPNAALAPGSMLPDSAAALAAMAAPGSYPSPVIFARK